MTNEIIIAVVGLAGSIATGIITKKRVQREAGALVTAKAAEDVQAVYQKIIHDLQLQNEKLLEDRDYYLTENIRITKENQDLRSEIQRISNEMQKLIIKVELFHDKYCINDDCKRRKNES